MGKGCSNKMITASLQLEQGAQIEKVTGHLVHTHCTFFIFSAGAEQTDQSWYQIILSGDSADIRRQSFRQWDADERCGAQLLPRLYRLPWLPWLPSQPIMQQSVCLSVSAWKVFNKDDFFWTFFRLKNCDNVQIPAAYNIIHVHSHCIWQQQLTLQVKRQWSELCLKKAGLSSSFPAQR